MNCVSPGGNPVELYARLTCVVSDTWYALILSDRGLTVSPLLMRLG